VLPSTLPFPGPPLLQRCRGGPHSDRMRFPDSPDAGKVAYYFESLDFPVPQRALTSFLAEFESIEMKDNRFHNHPGIEFLYVISGGPLKVRKGYPFDSAYPYRLCFGRRRVFCVASDDAVRFRCRCQRLLNQAVEELAPTPRFSSIEPKRKFVEVVR
jgi:hypothetical protein